MQDFADTTPMPWPDGRLAAPARRRANERTDMAIAVAVTFSVLGAAALYAAKPWQWGSGRGALAWATPGNAAEPGMPVPASTTATTANTHGLGLGSGMADTANAKATTATAAISATATQDATTAAQPEQEARPGALAQTAGAAVGAGAAGAVAGAGAVTGAGAGAVASAAVTAAPGSFALPNTTPPARSAMASGVLGAPTNPGPAPSPAPVLAPAPAATAAATPATTPAPTQATAPPSAVAPAPATLPAAPNAVAPASPPPAQQPLGKPVTRAPAGEKLLLRAYIQFGHDSAVLPDEAKPRLDEVAQALIAQPRRVTIAGHTDRYGSRAYNRQLSQRRAESVRQYLVLQGVAPANLVAVGYGETRPLGKTRAAAGRAENRRIDITE